MKPGECRIGLGKFLPADNDGSYEGVVYGTGCKQVASPPPPPPAGSVQYSPTVFKNLAGDNIASFYNANLGSCMDECKKVREKKGVLCARSPVREKACDLSPLTKRPVHTSKKSEHRVPRLQHLPPKRVRWRHARKPVRSENVLGRAHLLPRPNGHLGRRLHEPVRDQPQLRFFSLRMHRKKKHEVPLSPFIY